MTLDFIIIGAEKSGTTLLVELLRRSDQIAMPAREVRYFRDPFFPNHEQPNKFFGKETEGRSRGIKHPSYLGRPEVPARIRQHSPHAKLIAILRDPVERAIASYLHYLRHGQIPCIHPNVGLPIVFERPASSPKYAEIIEFGNYAKYVAQYLTEFPRNNLLLLEFEDFVQSTHATDVFDFLGVASPQIERPLPCVNAGNYNWSECVHQYRNSIRTLNYDRRMNIVGLRDAGAPEPYAPTQPSLIEIEPSIRGLIRTRYERQSQDLASLGLLTPRYWNAT